MNVESKIDLREEVINKERTFGSNTAYYPAYVVTSDESNMGTLTCTKEYEKIDYLTSCGFKQVDQLDNSVILAFSHFLTDDLDDELEDDLEDLF